MSYNIIHYDFFLSLINVYLKLIPEHTCIAYKSAKITIFIFCSNVSIEVVQIGLLSLSKKLFVKVLS